MKPPRALVVLGVIAALLAAAPAPTTAAHPKLCIFMGKPFEYFNDTVFDLCDISGLTVTGTSKEGHIVRARLFQPFPALDDFKTESECEVASVTQKGSKSERCYGDTKTWQQGFSDPPAENTVNLEYLASDAHPASFKVKFICDQNGIPGVPRVTETLIYPDWAFLEVSAVSMCSPVATGFKGWWKLWINGYFEGEPGGSPNLVLGAMIGVCFCFHCFSIPLCCLIVASCGIYRLGRTRDAAQHDAEASSMRGALLADVEGSTVGLGPVSRPKGPPVTLYACRNVARDAAIEFFSRHRAVREVDRDPRGGGDMLHLTMGDGTTLTVGVPPTESYFVNETVRLGLRGFLREILGDGGVQEGSTFLGVLQATKVCIGFPGTDESMIETPSDARGVLGDAAREFNGFLLVPPRVVDMSFNDVGRDGEGTDLPVLFA